MGFWNPYPCSVQHSAGQSGSLVNIRHEKMCPDRDILNINILIAAFYCLYIKIKSITQLTGTLLLSLSIHFTFFKVVHNIFTSPNRCIPSIRLSHCELKAPEIGYPVSWLEAAETLFTFSQICCWDSALWYSEMQSRN